MSLEINTFVPFVLMKVNKCKKTLKEASIFWSRITCPHKELQTELSKNNLFFMLYWNCTSSNPYIKEYADRI